MSREAGMAYRKLSIGLVSFIALIAANDGATAAACNTPFVVGDVFASVGNSTVNVFTPTGTSVCSLTNTSGTTFTTGSAFDSSGNFYVTNFGAGTVSLFNNTGGLVNSSFMSATNTPESIVIAETGPFSGSSFVGGPSAGATIQQFNTLTGALVHSYSVVGGNGTGGTDWGQFLSSSSSVFLYNGEGTQIKAFNLSTNTQLPNFPVLLPRVLSAASLLFE
jgi:hypothetical protein